MEGVRRFAHFAVASSLSSAGCTPPAEETPSEASIGQSADASTGHQVVLGNGSSPGCLTVIPATMRIEERPCEFDRNGHSTNLAQRLTLERYRTHFDGMAFVGHRLRQGNRCLRSDGSMQPCSSPPAMPSRIERSEMVTIPSAAIPAGGRNAHASFAIRWTGTGARPQCLAQHVGDGTLFSTTCPAGPSMNNPNEFSAKPGTSFGWIALGI
jgi:hypothetical protein